MPTEPVRRRRKRIESNASRRLRKVAIYGGILLVLVVVLAVGGNQIYKRVRHQRMMDRARASIEKKEYQQAVLPLARALQLDPNDYEATRMMAEAAEGAASREEIPVRRRVAELRPTNENHLAWASAALRFNDVESAEEALAELDAEGRNTAGYHDAAARLAALTRRSTKVEEHIAQAAKLDPTNDLYQLQLATMRMGSPLPEVRKQAFGTIERVAENPKMRRQALRTLIQGAAFVGDGSRMLRAGEQLRLSPDATFEDRLIYLNMLRNIPRMELGWYIAQLRSGNSETPENLALLLSWLNNHGMPHIALDWAKSLPEATRFGPPVCVAVAESYALLGDWKGIGPLLKLGKWEDDLDFQRDALSAWVERAQGNENGSTKLWAKAVTKAGDRPEGLTTLLRLAATWRWEAEHSEVLWVMAKGRSLAKPALAVLQRQYAAKEKTREMLTVFSRMLDEPSNAAAKNNVAYASLLLSTDVERAQTLAAEAHQSEPANPSFAATYALALHLRGKTNDGLRIMSALHEKDLAAPSTALCYGVILAASNAAAEAKKHLDVAEAGRLLPQEKALAQKAREKLSKR